MASARRYRRRMMAIRRDSPDDMLPPDDGHISADGPISIPARRGRAPVAMPSTAGQSALAISGAPGDSAPQRLTSRRCRVLARRGLPRRRYAGASILADASRRPPPCHSRPPSMLARRQLAILKRRSSAFELLSVCALADAARRRYHVPGRSDWRFTFRWDSSSRQNNELAIDSFDFVALMPLSPGRQGASAMPHRLMSRRLFGAFTRRRVDAMRRDNIAHETHLPAPRHVAITAYEKLGNTPRLMAPI